MARQSNGTCCSTPRFAESVELRANAALSLAEYHRRLKLGVDEGTAGRMLARDIERRLVVSPNWRYS